MDSGADQCDGIFLKAVQYEGSCEWETRLIMNTRTEADPGTYQAIYLVQNTNCTIT